MSETSPDKPSDFPESFVSTLSEKAKILYETLKAKNRSPELISGFAHQSIQNWKGASLDGSSEGLINLDAYKKDSLTAEEKQNLVRFVLEFQAGHLLPKAQDGLLGVKSLHAFSCSLLALQLRREVSTSSDGVVDTGALRSQEVSMKKYVDIGKNVCLCADSLLKQVGIASTGPRLGGNGFSTNTLVNQLLASDLRKWEGKTLVLGGQGNGWASAKSATERLAKKIQEKRLTIRLVVNLRVPYSKNQHNKDRYDTYEAQRKDYALWAKANADQLGFVCFDQEAIFQDRVPTCYDAVHPSFGSGYYQEVSWRLKHFIESIHEPSAYV